MPLRDHFVKGPRDTEWTSIHGTWPGFLAQKLNEILPAQFVARPRIFIGTAMEIDLAALETANWQNSAGATEGGLAMAAVPQATVLLEDDIPTPSDYELLIYDRPDFNVVAAIELVSPSNKDRPDSRQAFVRKCATLLRNGVSVAVVDPVTQRHANLYGELQEELATKRTAVAEAPLYAVSCRGRRRGNRWRLEAYEHELHVGRPLPTLPLWLTEEYYVNVELEATYEVTCRSLRMD